MRSHLNKEQRIARRKNWQESLVKKGNKIKDNKKNVLCPRCIFKEQDLTLSSQGYFTPCCWFDDELYRNQPWVDSFFNSHLNIKNHENIQDIFDSKEWVDFWDMLLNRPEEAPPICYEYCAAPQGDKEILEKTDDYEVIRRH